MAPGGMDRVVSKWAAGASYGPVLSQTDLYLLNTELEIHPILANKHASFHLVFNLVTGQTGGFNHNERDRDLAFTAKDEPATLPRVSQLIIITEQSPWCTIVTNERGVTMSDVCSAIWKDYTDHNVTDPEFASLAPRVQEQVKRTATHNAGATQGWMSYYSPAVTPNRYKRVDWLRERIFFEALRKSDQYAASRLGFRASNIFIMDLAS